MIERPKYLRQLIDNKDNGFPKVITGIRRCGKSSLLKEIYRNYLLSIGVLKENIISIELDDINNVKYRDPFELNKYVLEKCNTNSMHYVFIDEIQLVNTIINPVYTDGKHVIAKNGDEGAIGFVEVVLGLSRKKNIDLYVTGSNSKMLSSDIVTEFRDKAINIHLQPLSFEEFFNYKGGYKTEAFEEYLRYGGMPLAVLKNSEQEKKEYLTRLFETTYFKDILEHNNLNKSESLDELCTILSSECGHLINADKIANIYESNKKENIDKATVSKYINFFVDAFILNPVERYDLKGKNRIGALRKYYFIDNGLRNARLNFSSLDEGQMLENLVYNELIYNGYTVNVGVYDKVEKNKNGVSIKKVMRLIS
ncbi:MAG: ATP-binding protein [Bacilli bacterium]|nr:ATP-binding protein [Bacilli bacterium]